MKASLFFWGKIFSQAVVIMRGLQARNSSLLDLPPNNGYVFFLVSKVIGLTMPSHL